MKIFKVVEEETREYIFKEDKRSFLGFRFFIEVIIIFIIVGGITYMILK